MADSCRQAMTRAESATIFVNPTAGAGNACKQIENVGKEAKRLGLSAEFVECRSAEEYRQKVREAVAAGGKTLAAMGGDGTLQILARAAIGSGSRIAVIPAGSGNDFAKALGIRDWREGLRAIAQGRCRAVDLVKVTFADGHEAIYVGGGGMGLDANAAKLVNERFASLRGRVRYLAAAISALAGFNGLEIEAEFPESDETATRARVLLAGALNTPSYGGGLRLAPGARIDDGKLDFVALDMMSAAQVLAILPRLLISGELRTKRIKRCRAARITLRAPEDAWFHGDGELLGKGSCEVVVLPKAIEVFVP